MKKRFPFECYKVLPLTFDDSLSYYEVLCKLRDTINAIIKAGQTGLTPWGEIQGDIQDQTDLQNEFATKQNKLTVNPSGATATLTSIEIDGTKYNVGAQTGTAWGSITGTLSDQTDLQAALTTINALIAEKSTVAANPAAIPTAHLVKVTINGTTYDFQSELPIASATTLGGVKAAGKTSSETVEVKIGTDGKLYVPAASTGQSVAGVTVAGTSVVDTTDNTAKIPAASSSTYGAVKVGDGLRVDGVSGKTEVAVADIEDIDNETANAIIDAENVRYAATEAMKDNTMTSADKAAIKTNLGVNSVSGVATGDNWSSITIDGTTKNIPSGGTSQVAWGNISGTLSNQTDLNNALNSKASVSGTASGNNWSEITINGTSKNIPAATATAWGTITGTLSNQTDLHTAIGAKSTVTVSSSSAGSSATTIHSMTLDGVPYNFPEGGSGGEVRPVPGSGVNIDYGDTTATISAKLGNGLTFNSSNAIVPNYSYVQGTIEAGNGIIKEDDEISVDYGTVQHKMLDGYGVVISEDAFPVIDVDTDVIQEKLEGTKTAEQTEVAGVYDKKIYTKPIPAVSGTASGDNWGTITINGTTKNIPTPTATTWGNITGTLSNQSDLNNALNAKSSVSGTSSGDVWSSITIDGTTKNIPSGGATVSWGDIEGTLADQTDLQDELDDAAETASWGHIDGTLSNQTDLQEELDSKVSVIMIGDQMATGTETYEKIIPLASGATNGAIVGVGPLSSQTEAAGVSEGRIYTKPIPTVSASTSATTGASDLGSITVDGTAYNIPAASSTTVSAGNGIDVTETTGDYAVSAKLKSQGGLAVDTNGIYVSDAPSCNGLTFEVVDGIPINPVANRVYFILEE